MFYRKTLEDNLIQASTPEECIDAFEKMCRERSGLFDDMLLFESGNFDYAGKKEYYFTLMRQYKDSAFNDDFTVLRLDLIYPKQDITFKNRRTLKRHFTSDGCGGSFTKFFDKIRLSPALAYIHKNDLHFLRYEITEEELV